MGKRTTFPTSYAQNVRPIIRKQGRFDDGMRLDKDCSALDIGQNGDYPHALSYLNNCRGHRNHIIGDPGTVRFTAANAALTITDNTESAATAVTSGELYAANDDVAPAAGWIFEVLGTGDFTGNDLEAAKGDVVRPRDHFGIINDTPEFIYLGNCRIPAIPGYGDTSATEISATKAGTTITRVSGPEFTENLVGSYFVWGDRYIIPKHLNRGQCAKLNPRYMLLINTERFGITLLWRGKKYIGPKVFPPQDGMKLLGVQIQSSVQKCPHWLMITKI